MRDQLRNEPIIRLGGGATEYERALTPQGVDSLLNNAPKTVDDEYAPTIIQTGLRPERGVRPGDRFGGARTVGNNPGANRPGKPLRYPKRASPNGRGSGGVGGLRAPGMGDSFSDRMPGAQPDAFADRRSPFQMPMDRRGGFDASTLPQRDFYQNPFGRIRRIMQANRRLI